MNNRLPEFKSIAEFEKTSGAVGAAAGFIEGGRLAVKFMSQADQTDGGAVTRHIGAASEQKTFASRLMVDGGVMIGDAAMGATSAFALAWAVRASIFYARTSIVNRRRAPSVKALRKVEPFQHPKEFSNSED